MRESQIERHLVERVHALGGEVRKVRWLGRDGAPDRVVMLPEWVLIGNVWRRLPRTIWVECKAPGKEPEPHQEREHLRMRRMGQLVVVVDSIEAVEELLS